MTVKVNSKVVAPAMIVTNLLEFDVLDTVIFTFPERFAWAHLLRGEEGLVIGGTYIWEWMG